MSFTLGRIVDITAQSSFDYKTFEEVPVFGDVSPGDIGQYDLYNLLQREGIISISKIVIFGAFHSSPVLREARRSTEMTPK